MAIKLNFLVLKVKVMEKKLDIANGRRAAVSELQILYNYV